MLLGIAQSDHVFEPLLTERVVFVLAGRSNRLFFGPFGLQRGAVTRQGGTFVLQAAPGQVGGPRARQGLLQAGRAGHASQGTWGRSAPNGGEDLYRPNQRRTREEDDEDGDAGPTAESPPPFQR
jgi:hypothetical protein